MSIIKSINKFVAYPDINKLLRFIEYGKVVNQTTLYELRKNNFKGYQRPVFFLSTGRCGTSWFTKLLSKQKDLKVFHVPSPELAPQSKLAYNYLQSNTLTPREEKVLTEVFLAGREDLLLNCIKSNRRFIETDPRPTFFAPIIAQIWPDAIFIHLYRHPASVVRSGIERNWFSSEETHELSRITPLKSDYYYNDWSKFNQLQKITWLWTETNKFVEEFKADLPDNRYSEFNFDELNAENVKTLLNFLEIGISSQKINKLLSTKVNKQMVRTFPAYKDWSEEMKGQLKEIAGDLMNKYHYN